MRKGVREGALSLPLGARRVVWLDSQQRLAEDASLVGEELAEVAPAVDQDAALGLQRRRARGGGDRRREVERAVEAFVVGDDLVDRAETERLLGVEGATGQRDLGRRGEAERGPRRRVG